MPPRLRVLAGPSTDLLQCISSVVNTTKPHRIVSEYFDGEVVVNIKDFPNHQGEAVESEYFKREERQGITWSFQVQGRFLVPYSADDIMFGNTFDRPLHLPWGSGAALKFMNYIDPTLTHDLTSPTKPWALSPLASTMPHFAHTRLLASSPPSSSPSSSSSSLSLSSESGHGTPSLPAFPPSHSLSDDTRQLHLALSVPSPASSASSVSSKGSAKSRLSIHSSSSKSKAKKSTSVMDLKTAGQRRSYFSSANNRREVVFGPKDVLTVDFCYGFLEFNPRLALRLPGGVSFDLMRYWDGQPVRFVCCERKEGKAGEGEEPWGRIFWCIVIELDEGDDEGTS